MSPESVRIACLQMNSGNEFTVNLTTFSAMAREAAERGAEFILSPEYFLMMDGSGRVMREAALDEQGEPAISALTELARELGVWLLAGSITLKSGEGRMCNRSILISAGGDVVATYDKIHMFDATLPDGKVIRESSAYRPGESAVLAQTPWGTLGMTVCYDLRFPGLFRALAQAGAILITVPSSFQRQTGRAHWHALLRARAIENECFILAPAMCGDHAGNRQSYGHTLVVDPWGEVIAEGGESPEIVYAEIETRRVARVRGMIPSLDHDRPFAPPARPA
ncbi:MAG TPA: carbon-nitrogen hydrolase family protein [Burkholderiales bacterium]|nr:carbon-nitrogen hydrolase family protein [Burkholderiales bacterium]